MPKNSKKSKAAATGGTAPGTSSDVIQRGNPPGIETPARAKTPSVRAVARTKPGKHSGVTTRKTAPGTKPKKAASRKTSLPVAAMISDDDIRLRAYLLSEWRMRNGIAGDSELDWLEARRQLQEESRRNA